MHRIMSDMALPPRSNRNNLVSSTIAIVPRTCLLNKAEVLTETIPSIALLLLEATPLILSSSTSSARPPHPWMAAVGTLVAHRLTCSTHSILHRTRDLAHQGVAATMAPAALSWTIGLSRRVVTCITVTGPTLLKPTMMKSKSKAELLVVRIRMAVITTTILVSRVPSLVLP